MTTTNKIANITFDQMHIQLDKLFNNYIENEYVPISEIPDVLIDDFSEFNSGNTMSMIDDKPCVPYRDFRHWYNKLNSVGFDYQIQFLKA